jgi:hypothetical protein
VAAVSARARRLAARLSEQVRREIRLLAWFCADASWAATRSLIRRVSEPLLLRGVQPPRAADGAVA